MTARPQYAPAGFLAGFPVAQAAPVARVKLVVRAALYLYVLSIPFELPNRTIPLEIPTLTGFIFLATTLLQPSASFRRPPGAVVWFLLHVWILAALGVVALFSDAKHLEPLIRHLVVLVQVIFLCWTTFNLLKDPGVLRGVVLTLALACIVRATAQVVGFGTSVQVDSWYGDARVTAFGQNANLAAMVLTAGLATVLGLQLSPDRRLPRFGLLTWPIAAVLAVAVIQTGSRGGLLSAAAAIAAFGLTGRTPGQWLRNGLVGLGLLVTLGWGAMQSDTMRHRFDRATGGYQSDLAGRERIYPAAFIMFVERPLLGWGPIENQHEIARRIDQHALDYTDAHNLMLELVTSSGLLGALPFLIGLGLCVAAGWRARRGALGALPLALLGATLTGTLSGTWISAKILWLAFAIALAAETHWTPKPAPGPRR